jgi:NADP-dependent 3-hydroxy acid dehydrogenase YdfG
MPFPYKRVLVVGATSGIGEALANRFIEEGASVIVVGRRKDQLESFVHRHGKDKATAVPFDITELSKIPNFVTKYAHKLWWKPMLAF